MKKPLKTIPEATQMLQKMQESNMPSMFNETAQGLWQDKMDDIFAFYLGKIKECICLAFKKNLTSEIVYEISINCVRDVSLTIYDSKLKKTFYIAGMSGIGLRPSEFQRDTGRWDEYSCTLIRDNFITLKIYFDHLKDENLHKKLKGGDNS